MTHPPATSSKEDLISFAEDGAMLMEAEDHPGAFKLTLHDLNARWIPACENRGDQVVRQMPPWSDGHRGGEVDGRWTTQRCGGMDPGHSERPSTRCTKDDLVGDSMELSDVSKRDVSKRRMKGLGCR